MAMTANGELGPSPSALAQPHPNRTSPSDPEAAAAPIPEERPRTMRSHSGLSALIQAATSQFSNLAEGATSDASDYHSRHRDGYASSNDTDLRSSTNTQTPTIVPEEHGRKLSAFPERLMTLLLDSQNSDILTFLPDGKFFAIRSKEFAQDLMIHHLHVSSFVDFLELIQGWGFTRINSSNNTRSSGIQVFRHPHFRKGYAKELRRIRFGQNPTDARVMAIPDRARIEYSFSDDSGLSTSKRRLSPSHVASQESTDASQRQRVVGDPSSDVASDQEQPLSSPTPTVVTRSKSQDSAEMNASSRRSSVDFRSHALAITTEKLNIQCSEDDDDDVDNNNTSDDQKHTVRLIDGGVERATHTIVTDAIETLLRDEGHTRETYLKHEKELSISSLPGVVPISKQLFSPSENNQTTTGQGEEEAAPPSGSTDEGSKENALTSHASDSKLEAAAALLCQASSAKNGVPPLPATF